MTSNNKYLVEEYRGRINRVMDYLEQHMEQAHKLEELAEVANFSKFHFSRIFWAMTGETPFEFIMRIRMQRAASTLLMHPRETISEVAYACGYSSLPVFSRNFKAYFNMSPSDWRQRFLDNPDALKEYHRNHYQTNRNPEKTLRKEGQAGQSSTGYFSEQYEPLKWRTNMEICKGVEVRELPKTTIAYVRHVGPYAGDDKLFEHLYGELFTWAGPRNLTGRNDLKTYNIYHDDPSVTEAQKLRVSVGISVPAETKVEGKIGKLDLEGGRYAIARFELGPQDYPRAWGWIFGEWFPSSGYQPGDGPSFEMCGKMEMDGGTHEVDICVPVKPM